MQDERGRFVVAAGQNDQAPHPDRGIWRFVTLLGNAQPRLLGISLSSFVAGERSPPLFWAGAQVGDVSLGRDWL